MADDPPGAVDTALPRLVRRQLDAEQPNFLMAFSGHEQFARPIATGCIVSEALGLSLSLRVACLGCVSDPILPAKHLRQHILDRPGRAIRGIPVRQTERTA